MDSIVHKLGLPATPARGEQQPGGVTAKQKWEPVRRATLGPLQTSVLTGEDGPSSP